MIGVEPATPDVVRCVPDFSALTQASIRSKEGCVYPAYSIKILDIEVGSVFEARVTESEYVVADAQTFDSGRQTRVMTQHVDGLSPVPKVAFAVQDIQNN